MNMTNRFHFSSLKSASLLACTLITFLLSTSSCLKRSIGELESYDNAEITNVSGVYYRYLSTNGLQMVEIQGGEDAIIDSEKGTVDIDVVEVPYAIYATIPEESRSGLTQKNISVVVSLSTAAVLKPQEGSATLGISGDWSHPNSYTVTAASGKEKKWTITIHRFTIQTEESTESATPAE